MSPLYPCRPYPCHPQLTTTECAGACLQNIEAFYGLEPTDSEKLRKLAGTNGRGTSLEGLRDAAEATDFDSECFVCSTEELPEVRLPAIIQVRASGERLHYVVVYEISSDDVCIADPAVGPGVQIVNRRFLTIWTGCLMTLKPRGRRPPQPTPTAATRCQVQLRSGVATVARQGLLRSLGTVALTIGALVLLRALLLTLARGSMGELLAAGILLGGFEYLILKCEASCERFAILIKSRCERLLSYELSQYCASTHDKARNLSPLRKDIRRLGNVTRTLVLAWISAVKAFMLMVVLFVVAPGIGCLVAACALVEVLAALASVTVLRERLRQAAKAISDCDFAYTSGSRSSWQLFWASLKSIAATKRLDMERVTGQEERFITLALQTMAYVTAGALGLSDNLPLGVAIFLCVLTRRVINYVRATTASFAAIDRVRICWSRLKLVMEERLARSRNEVTAS